MAIGRKQIGWSQESNLLWEISRQMDRLGGIISPNKYKVYVALLTQTGGDNILDLNYPDLLTVGVTYEIFGGDSNYDFTNVGAPNNNIGTKFVATGTTPTSWGDSNSALLKYNQGAPVVTVLENTIGNITWNWANDGYYSTNELFDQTKTYTSITNNSFNTNLKTLGIGVLGPNDPVTVYSGDNNDILVNTPIEIRVYQ